MTRHFQNIMLGSFGPCIVKTIHCRAKNSSTSELSFVLCIANAACLDTKTATIPVQAAWYSFHSSSAAIEPAAGSALVTPRLP